MSFRPLRPKPEGQRSQLDQPPRPVGDPKLPKRPNVPAACSACKKRKTRCDGNRPSCAACAAQQRACQYDVPEGLTSRQGVLRKVQEVEQQNSTLKTAAEKLEVAVGRLCQGDEATAFAMLRHLRRSYTPLDALGSLGDALLLLPQSSTSSTSVNRPNKRSRALEDAEPSVSPETHPIAPCPSSGPRVSLPLGFRDGSSPTNSEDWERFVTAHMGMDEGIINLPIKPLPVSSWTRLSTDDKHLTHLLDLFWTWENTVSRAIHRDTFRDALMATFPANTQNDRGTFQPCSSFLVNAMLAVGCMYSTGGRDLANTEDVMSRGRLYADEALRLHDKSQKDDSASIAFVQATALLWVYEGNIGDGSLALRLLDEVFRLYGSFDFKNFQPPLETSASETTRWTATSHFAWGWYIVAAKIDLTFTRPLRIAQPAIPIPQGDSGTCLSAQQITPGSWFAYPVSLKCLEPHQKDLYRAECNLAILAQEVLDFCVNSGASIAAPSWAAELSAIYAKLTSWKADLVDCLQLNDTELPSVLLMHNTHNALVLKLVEGLPPQATIKFGKQCLETLRISHAALLMTSVRTYRLLYPLNRENWSMQGCFAAATALLPYLADGTVQLDIFAQACQALHELGQFLPVANSFLEGIKSLVTLQKIDVPRYGAKYLKSQPGPNHSVYAAAVRVLVPLDSSKSGDVVTLSDLLPNSDGSDTVLD